MGFRIQGQETQLPGPEFDAPPPKKKKRFRPCWVYGSFRTLQPNSRLPPAPRARSAFLPCLTPSFAPRSTLAAHFSMP